MRADRFCLKTLILAVNSMPDVGVTHNQTVRRYVASTRWREEAGRHRFSSRGNYLPNREQLWLEKSD
jgi:hypothetical protein